jgi:flagellar basal-body rod protein FlgB
MDLNNLPLFRAMAKRMAWLSERQQTLAQNVANADTPGYTAHDLKPQSFRQLIGTDSARLRLAGTQPMHLAGAAELRAARFATIAEKGERSPDGNGVDLETEMVKVSETATEFSLASNLYRRHIAMVKSVLGHSSS